MVLLSTDEARDRRYFAGDGDRSIGTWWWLRSPGYYFGPAACVYSDGEVYGGGNNYYGNVDDERGVRPALYLNLSSSIFTSSSSKYETLYSVPVEVRGADGSGIKGAAVAAPGLKIFTGSGGRAELKLGAGTHIVRVSVAGIGEKEVKVQVPLFLSRIVIDMK